MQRTIPIVAIGMFMTIFTVGLAPTADATHCESLLGPREWVCHPNQDVWVDTSGLENCAWPCSETPVRSVEPTEEAGLWLVLCAVSTPVGTVTIYTVSAGTTPSCPQGNAPETAEGLAPGVEEGATAFTLVDGLCYVRVTATAYGFGWQDEPVPVYCAYIK